MLRVMLSIVIWFANLCEEGRLQEHDLGMASVRMMASSIRLDLTCTGIGTYVSAS